MEKTVYSVSELNRTARQLIETGLPALWVEGEISNLARPRSGHIYFSLKDSNAQLRCAMFRNRNQLLRVAPEDGQQVLVRGRLTLYEARGDYQMIVEQIEPAGEGLLRQQFEELKNKLEREGLLTESRKKALPQLPRRIGIITSPSGAAVRDVITVARRRMPGVPIVVYPAAVQGAEAPAALLSALQTAIARDECDLLIIGRGGGSLEDLWAFNDETLARAVADCPIPIISAVGHEVDFTICDFVADLRAATPSAAAEYALPNHVDLLQRLERHQSALATSMERQIHSHTQTLDWLGKRLIPQHPGRRLADDRSKLEALADRAARALRDRQTATTQRVNEQSLRLLAREPSQQIQLQSARLNTVNDRIRRAISTQVESRAQRLKVAGHSLHTVSPLATLDRGYAIATDQQQMVLKSSNQVDKGASIQVRLADGTLDCEVTEKQAAN